MRRKHLLPAMLVIGLAIVVCGSSAVQAEPPATQLEETITLKIDGWTCASCEKDIRKALLAVPGVKKADVSYKRGGAIVEVEPGRVNSEQLIQAVASAGSILSSYHATVVPNGTLSARQSGAERGWLQSFSDLFR